GDWIRQGVLQREEWPSFYVYQHRFQLGEQCRQRLGFFAALRLADPEAGIVLPHEGTLPHSLQAATERLRDLRAEPSAVYTLVEDDGQIEQILGRVVAGCPDGECADGEGGMHRWWIVSDLPTIAALRDALLGRQLYIADGHHRYAAALAYRDERSRQPGGANGAEFVLAYVADAADPGTTVLPIHRSISDVSVTEFDRWLGCLRGTFEVDDIVDLSAISTSDPGSLASEIEYELDQGELPRYCLLGPDRLLRRLQLSRWDAIENGNGDLTSRMDATIADEWILGRAFGIGANKIEQRVRFVPGTAEAARRAIADPTSVTLFLRSTPLDQLLRVARAGQRMPRKSTYFYPKLPIGLVAYDLDDGPGSGDPH
ncbi:MAG TPA: DUF1015 domain-containing protein, partial [Thermomicrobiaceae bacterium]|nr:DUF1015 domain-containing protein [Thermomicrobiaceae bacterium]